MLAELTGNEFAPIVKTIRIGIRFGSVVRRTDRERFCIIGADGLDFPLVTGALSEVEFRIDAAVGEGYVEVAAIGKVGKLQARAVAEKEVAQNGILAGEIFLDTGRGNARVASSIPATVPLGATPGPVGDMVIS